ncbi:hypothetical protein MPTK1_1g00170 [Marchantia polymorpha subsp. ruderalis]|uniref:Uncharacterized protein n=2 Tax=Marchantia polymorpha TaxID=3197 RepID=A0AAF6AJV6_MARPO|nr:hypothetical protein MARPO_0103s0069 [Marchantia polymorpha]BBM96726.1 hypothetical protein Mp_1g00170 [Marchantia polymorpha subsp. ruderalis]|eukprot:PTQ32102.1 hypothetical protein MARPO_0103s0069 [Marchantia polymorpha]
MMRMEMTENEVEEKQDEMNVVSQEPRTCGILISIISRAQACVYDAAEFFVAWQGVLTIAFCGIPNSILQIKRDVDQELQGVVRENPGSKWPKTSVACLRDDKVLTLEQLSKLRRICSEESPALAASTPPVIVDNLSVVLYENCCLEKIILEATTPLRLPVETSKPTSEEKAHVRGVMDEFAAENLEVYHVFTSKFGNRSAHYRNSKAGATLVHFLKTVPAALARFRQRVDEDLPGMYDWFSDSSLHITIRAL